MGNLGPKKLSSTTHSRILNPLLNTPGFIVGDKSKHGTRAPVPVCREGVQQRQQENLQFPFQSCLATAILGENYSNAVGSSLLPLAKKNSKKFYIKDINKLIL